MARGKHYWHLDSRLIRQSFDRHLQPRYILDIFSFKSLEWSSNSIAHEDMHHYRKPRRCIHHKKEQHHILVLLCGVVTAVPAERQGAMAT